MNQLVQRAFPGLVKFDEDGAPHQVIAPLASRRLLEEWQETPLPAFQELFSKRAGEEFEQYWPKAESLYREYGPVLSCPLVSAFLYAAEDRRLPWCIEVLEQHLKDDLQFQHPDLRGRLIIGDAPQNRSYLFIVYKIIKELRPSLFK